MEQSYIPAGTDVICTEMMGGMPAQLGLTRTPNVFYGEEKRPLLNICDKKLSCSLQCRIKQMYFSGLSGLLAGLALGAFAVLFVVATMGTGAVVVAAACAFVALGVGSGVADGAALAYKYVANECDCTLSGQWSFYHSKVFLDGGRPLLERSILTCTKGGVVSLVMDHAKAVELAKMISAGNEKIKSKNKESKVWQGFVDGASNAVLAGLEGMGGGAVFGLVVGSGLTTYHYLKGGNGSYRDDNALKQSLYAVDVFELDNNQAELEADRDVLTGQDVGDAATGIVADAGYSVCDNVMSATTRNKQLGREAGDLTGKAARYANAGNHAMADHAMWAHDLALDAQVGTKEIGRDFIKGMWTGKTSVFKWKVSNKWLTLSGIGIGILSSILCNYIEAWANEDENLVYLSMIEKIYKARHGHISRISVIANSL